MQDLIFYVRRVIEDRDAGTVGGLPLLNVAWRAQGPAAQYIAISKQLSLLNIFLGRLKIMLIFE